MNAYAEPFACVPLIIRRVVNRLGRPFGINPFPRAFNYALEDASRAKAFDSIYQENAWGSKESRSGVGSELAATEPYRQGLVALIAQRQFTSMFDAPCGDLRWMPQVIAASGIHYQGGDISASVVAQVNQQHPAVSVRVFDISRDAFPKVDVWHCRDCLFHLPFSDIKAALNNFVRSEIPYALLTTHKAWLMHRNLDLQGVGFRFVDLERAPISLPKPLAYVEDYKRGVEFPRYVGLWSRAMIREALAAHGWLE
jgi:hypothetical protein